MKDKTMVLRGRIEALSVSPAMNKIMAVILGKRMVHNLGVESYEAIGFGSNVVKQLSLSDGDVVSVSITKMRRSTKC
jgi:hypothetical protein